LLLGKYIYRYRLFLVCMYLCTVTLFMIHIFSENIQHLGEEQNTVWIWCCAILPPLFPLLFSFSAVTKFHFFPTLVLSILFLQHHCISYKLRHAFFVSETSNFFCHKNHLLSFSQMESVFFPLPPVLTEA